jgi:kynurenine formamidase
MKAPRSMMLAASLGFVGCVTLGYTLGEESPGRGWDKGKGWGWIWGKEDQVGSLNAMSDATRLAALALVRHGKVYDLGVPYDRESFKWPGHNPCEVMTFRSPEGVKRQGDVAGVADDPSGTGWHSCALFVSDNVGTQIDGLGHVTAGTDNHWYNGFTEAQAGGDFGVRKCDAVSIPPIVTPGVLIDVAGSKGLENLPAHSAIGVEDLRSALAWEKADIQPGDAVFIRTGVARHWGANGSNHEVLKALDGSGITIDAAKWLVEEKGAILIGSDTSGLELQPPPPGSKSFIPCHVYLIVEQGVHIGELHDFEGLARDKVYRFCYVALVNKIRGAAAGFTLRPIALY